MDVDTTYCYKGSKEFVIENGIIKSLNNPAHTERNSYGEYVLNQLKASPEFIGQIDGVSGREESFGIMMEKSVKCAMWLKELNIQPGDIVALCTQIHKDIYVPLLASLYLGAVFNPWWSTGMTIDIAKHYLTVAQPKIVFVDEASAGVVLEAAKEIEMPLKMLIFGNFSGFQSLDEILASQAAKSVAKFQCTNLSSPANPALLLFTSGSTGPPKAAVHSYRSLFVSVDNDIDNVAEGKIISLDNALPGWITCSLAILRAIVTRETRIIPPIYSEETFLQLIEKFKVTFIKMIPIHALRLQKLSASRNCDLSSLKYLSLGGTVLKEKTHKKLASDFPHCHVLQSYGMTELGGVVRQSSEHPKYGSTGTVLQNVQMKVVDTQSGVVLGPNQTGEACFKTPTMMTCYYKNPDLTNKKIDAEGWLHTGDLVYYDEEGNVYVTDRVESLLYCGDYMVAPATIEQVLQEHPAVFEVGVTSVPDELGYLLPIAYVVKRPDDQVTEEELLKLVETKLPAYMRLRGGVKFLEELPHTPSGKISRTDLKKMARLEADNNYNRGK